MAMERSARPPGRAPIDADRILQVIKALHRHRLDFLVIGNGGALLLGAPVITEDVDIFVRRTPRNIQKLVAFLQDLGIQGVSPSHLEEARFCEFQGLDFKVDIVFAPHGIRSFEGARARRIVLDVAGTPIWVASLEDIIASKEAADRAKDRPILNVLRGVQAYRREQGLDRVSDRRPRYRARRRR